MKPLKLFMDTRPGEQPESTYPYAKNGIQYDLAGSTFNEPGFTKQPAIIPYNYNGVIETDTKPVIFSTDGINSAIGFFNPVTGAYEAIVDDNPAHLVNWPAGGERLGFTRSKYITGQAQRNYKGELVIAFTDKDKFPKYLNCDKPKITRLDDLRLFPFYTPPTIELSESIGGSLEPGTYYVSVNYERNDGTVTPRSEVSTGLTIVPGAIAGSTDKAVQITITKADTSFDFIRVTVISKIAGKTTAVELSDLVPLSGGSVDLIYTGDNLSENITLAEVLTAPAVYDRVGTIGQLNDALYIADLHKEADYNDLQQIASMARLEWVSELIDATAPPEEHRTGKKKSLMHEEVYAFYLRFHKTRGGYTKAFHVPGLPGTASDLAASLEASAGGETAVVPRFKVEDTIPLFTAATKTGRFGTYVNDNETYPNTPDFDATTLGGQDLRGKKVRHHKAPSLRWCKQNLYPSVPEYGKTKLDLLGVKVSGIQIPAKYQGLIDGYELLYAKRTPANMTIMGQGALMHGFAPAGEANVPTGSANIYSTGGNWAAEVLHNSTGDYNDNWELTSVRQGTFRIHPFDVLFNKPSIKPTFISAQFKLRRDNLRSEGYLEDGYISSDRDAPQVMLVDYTLGNTPTDITAGKLIRKIKESFHLPMGLTMSKFNNIRHENCFAGTLAGADWPQYFGMMSWRLKDKWTEPGIVASCEETYVVNLVTIKEDVYSTFYSQRLVSAGTFKALNDSTPFWGGDTFCVDYTFHTYGRRDQNDTDGDGIRGIKVIRRVVCESSSNLHLRYELAGNDYSKWYPRTSVAPSNPDQCYITRFDRSKDPNQFGYTKDLNALNDFISSTVYSPFQEEIVDFPYRIHRGGKISRQNRPRAWRSFLPLDYYEMQKNMGRVINIEGQDDRLLIHMENALFQTQDKAKLDADLLSVTLGTGDIFQFEPQEALSSKLGYAGTQHDLACVKSPVGYIFIDSKLGEMFLLKGQLQNLNEGVNTFLREYLKVTGNNPYVGNGITVGWDQKYKRILLTVRNDQPATGKVIKDFENTNAFFNALQVGDIIRYQNQYIEYKGLNNPAFSGQDCAVATSLDTYGWVIGDVLCEQDTPVDQIPHDVEDGFVSLSSPALLQWDEPTGKLWVADHDNATGNFFTINPSTGQKSYLPYAGTLYSIVSDPVNRRIYGTALMGGLKVLDISTGSVITVPYGTDGALNRIGLWSIEDRLVARDRGTDSLVLIDKATLNVVAAKTVSTIPSGTTYLMNEFQLLGVNGSIWVVPVKNNTGTIAVYDADFTTLLAEYALPGTVVSNTDGGFFAMTGYYDSTHGTVYIHDVGSSTLHRVDTTGTVLSSRPFFLVGTTTNVRIAFRKDPITGSLYLEYTSVGVNDHRVYVIDRTTGSILHVYFNREIGGELIQQGTTPYMWVALPGIRSWESGSYNTDGQLIKYAHGQ